MKKFLQKLGSVLAAIFSCACGIIVINALITVFQIKSGIFLYMLSLLFFIAVFSTNYFRMFKTSVPEVLEDIFGHGFLKGWTTTYNGKVFSFGRKCVLAIGFICSFAVGALFAAITFNSVFVVAQSFSEKLANSLFAILIANGLAAAALICFTSLIMKSIAKILRTPDLWKLFRSRYKELISTDARLSHNKGKTCHRIFIERVITLSLLIIIVPLVTWGLLTTLNACARALAVILVNHHLLTAHHAVCVSKTIAFGLAFPGQVTFGVRTSFITVTGLFSRSKAKKLIASNQPWRVILYRAILRYGLEILRIISAIGNGMIAMLGAEGTIMMVLAGLGNTMSAYTAAVKDEKK